MLKVREYIFEKVWEESASVQCRFYRTLITVILSSLHSQHAGQRATANIEAVYSTSSILENENGVFRYIGPVHSAPPKEMKLTIALNLNFLLSALQGKGKSFRYKKTETNRYATISVINHNDKTSPILIKCSPYTYYITTAQLKLCSTKLLK